MSDVDSVDSAADSIASSVSTLGKSNGNGNGLAKGLGLNTNAEASNGGIMVDADIYERTPGWRYAKEVVAYLREKGAKITSLNEYGVDWSALVSDNEGDSPVNLKHAAGRDDIR